jgi:hypothetical protein
MSDPTTAAAATPSPATVEIDHEPFIDRYGVRLYGRLVEWFETHTAASKVADAINAALKSATPAAPDTDDDMTKGQTKRARDLLATGRADTFADARLMVAVEVNRSTPASPDPQADAEPSVGKVLVSCIDKISKAEVPIVEPLPKSPAAAFEAGYHMATLAAVSVMYAAAPKATADDPRPPSIKDLGVDTTRRTDWG